MASLGPVLAMAAPPYRLQTMGERVGIHRWTGVVVGLMHFTLGFGVLLLYSVIQIQDVTESMKLTLQLEYQASYDELTGLLNRRAFEMQLERAWENSANQEKKSHLMFTVTVDPRDAPNRLSAPEV